MTDLDLKALGGGTRRLPGISPRVGRCASRDLFQPNCADHAAQVYFSREPADIVFMRKNQKISATTTTTTAHAVAGSVARV